MRALLMILGALMLWCPGALADDRGRILGYVDESLDLPPPVREHPKVKVRIEPAPARPKSSTQKAKK
jgi:hypothetical protein